MFFFLSVCCLVNFFVFIASIEDLKYVLKLKANFWQKLIRIMTKSILAECHEILAK